MASCVPSTSFRISTLLRFRPSVCQNGSISSSSRVAQYCQRSRSFHGSTCLYLKKPSAAVIGKSPRSATKRQEKARKPTTDVPRHERHFAPRVAASVHRIHQQAPAYVASAEARSVSTQQDHVQVSVDVEESPAPSHATSIPTKSVARLPAVHQTYEQSLERKRESTLLYQAPDLRGFIRTSYGSGALMLLFGGSTITHYLLHSPTSWVLLTGGFVSTLWLGLGVWASFAPYKMIKSITFVPQQAYQRAAHRSPPLKVEFLQTLPGLKRPPVHLSLADITSHAPIAVEVEALARSRALVRRRSNWAKGFFRRVHSIFTNTRKMFTRESIVKMSIAGSGDWKLDLDGAILEEQGRALDKLLLTDAPTPLLRRLSA